MDVSVTYGCGFQNLWRGIINVFPLPFPPISYPEHLHPTLSYFLTVCKGVNINVTRSTVVTTTAKQQLSTCHVAFACQRQSPQPQSPQPQRPQKSCDPKYPKKLSHGRQETSCKKKTIQPEEESWHRPKKWLCLVNEWNVWRNEPLRELFQEFKSYGRLYF